MWVNGRVILFGIGLLLLLKQKTAYEIRFSVVGSEMCIRDFFFQAEDGIRDFSLSRGLGGVYRRQAKSTPWR